MDALFDAMDDAISIKSLRIELSRNQYQKLKMITDDLSNQADRDIRPDEVAKRIIETFINHAYGESVHKISKRLLPDMID